jgi:hypothetical protein
MGRVIVALTTVTLTLAITSAHAAPAVSASDRPSSLSARFVYLLPKGFRGWACTDFGVVGAPPLPREGDALVIRPRPGKVLKTSEKPPGLPPSGEAWIEVNGKRRPLPKNVYERRLGGHTDTKNPVARYCAFFGTEDEADAAGDPPGIFHSPERGVSPEEREALVALYNSTDGAHWTHRVGWLGAPGTECAWHGVRCSGRFALRNPGPPPAGGPSEFDVVSTLDLADNNLVGMVPPTIEHLTRLEWLYLHGNRLGGRLPDALVQRWLAGPLVITGDASLLTSVSEIARDSSSASLLCSHSQLTLRHDGSAKSLAKRCRAATPGDRTTFCEEKEGRFNPEQFARLATLIEKSGFLGLAPGYQRNITDAGFETLRVVRDGKPYQVSDYASAGPFELWVVQTAIDGVASSIEWERTITRSECPWAEDFRVPFRD